MYLNENEKKLISQEIENLEKKSSVELVAVITKNSSMYKYEKVLTALAITTIVSIIALFFNINTIIFFQLQLVVFTLIYSLFYYFEDLILYFIPKKYKHQKASYKANKEFQNLGIRNTKTKQGIMFFVSIDEKYVEIITDKHIKEKIDNKYWEDIINDFIKDVKNNELSKGYLKAINSCSKTLINKFPIQDNDINELSNEVREL